MMYAEWKTWLKAHVGLCILTLLLVAAAYFFLCSRENIPDDGSGACAARNELESARDDSTGIQERIGEAEKSADRIEESARRSGQLADEAESIARECEQIIEAIRRRAEEGKAAPET